jgi:transposase
MDIVEEVRSVWKRLSKAEQRGLKHMVFRSVNAQEQKRANVIRNLVRGEPVTRIVSLLACSRSQVRRVAQRFVEQGLEGLADRRADNGTAKVTEAYETAVLIAVALSPQAYGFPRPAWTQELLILAQLARGEVLLHVDEVDLHLNPKIGPDWMLSGQQKKVLTPGKNEKHYLAGALNVVTKRLSYVEGARKTSELFIRLIDHLLAEYSDSRRLHIVLDNFRIHSSKLVEAARLRWGGRVVFHFLPPYCPDHNRIERVWKDLHDNVTRNHRCADMHALLTRVREYLGLRARSRPESRKTI